MAPTGGARYAFRVRSALPIAIASALLAGCSAVDYLTHRDRVTLAGGDAVRANLERETLNPAKASMYTVAGLGGNGGVIPATTTDSLAE